MPEQCTLQELRLNHASEQTVAISLRLSCSSQTRDVRIHGKGRGYEASLLEAAPPSTSVPLLALWCRLTKATLRHEWVSNELMRRHDRSRLQNDPPLSGGNQAGTSPAPLLARQDRVSVSGTTRSPTSCVSGARASWWQSRTLLHARPLHATVRPFK